jgi:hypothetical protein
VSPILEPRVLDFSVLVVNRDPAPEDPIPVSEDEIPDPRSVR